MKLSEVKNGGTFKIGDIEFIKFYEKENGEVVAMTKNLVFKSEFGETNNFTKNSVLEKLKTEFLPKVMEIVGNKNICEFETDLSIFDEAKTYGTIKSKISLPTLGFFCEHVEIFDKYKLDDWYWLATACIIPPYNARFVLCVTPSCNPFWNVCFCNYGVRPILHFVSSISVSE